MSDKVNENMNREERKNFKEFLSKVRIVPEDQPIDDMTLVAGRIKDVPIPLVPSGTRKCGYCKETVWVDTKLLDKADKAQKIMCTVCLMDRLNQDWRYAKKE